VVGNGGYITMAFLILNKFKKKCCLDKHTDVYANALTIA